MIKRDKRKPGGELPAFCFLIKKAFLLMATGADAGGRQPDDVCGRRQHTSKKAAHAAEKTGRLQTISALGHPLAFAARIFETPVLGTVHIEKDGILGDAPDDGRGEDFVRDELLPF